jgi:ribose transport system permease protein
MEKIISILRRAFLPQYLMIWALIAMLVVFSILSPAFRSPDNLVEILRSAGIFGIMVLGETWIVALGEIDVTFPDIMAFSSMVVAYLVLKNVPWLTAILIALCSSALFGLLSGLLINELKVRSLIATIATTTIAASMAAIIGNDNPLNLPNIDPSVNFFVYGKVAGIPLLVIIVAVIYIIAGFIQNQTKLGQYLYALGDNRKAALEAGIHEKPIVYSFYVLSAVFAAIAGAMFIATFSGGKPQFGGSYFVDGLSVVFLGALVIKVGKPNVYGSLIGAIIIAALSNGSTLLGIPYYIGIIVKGFLIAGGVAAISISKTRSITRFKAERLERAAKEIANG